MKHVSALLPTPLSLVLTLGGALAHVCVCVCVCVPFTSSVASLKWNLDGERPLEFGSLISSSNEMVEEQIAVETDAPLLWTTGLRKGAPDAK
jgi:hypothetical protein